MPIRNISFTLGGTAQDALPANLGRTRVNIKPTTEDCWINFGATAAVDTGFKVANGTEKEFLVWKYPEVGGRLSIFSATTGAKISIEES
jgi:hypothetical protein